MSNLVHNKMFRHSLLCDQPTLIGTFVVLLSQPRELLQVFDPMAPKHSTIANNGRIGDMDGLPVRRSNDVAPSFVWLISVEKPNGVSQYPC